MLRRSLAPIHPDGWKFVAAAAVASAILFLLWPPGGWLSLAIAVWIAYFFRDPWRVTPLRAGLVVAPRIGIFLNLFDVHVARAPVAGTVAAMHYTRGRFVNASLDKASEHNERLAIRLTPAEGPDIAVVLIAGLVARRIVCRLDPGNGVAAGQRIGIIRFGSRIDVYVPPPYVTLVARGQRMVGGETVLADARAQEPARGGYAH